MIHMGNTKVTKLHVQNPKVIYKEQLTHQTSLKHKHMTPTSLKRPATYGVLSSYTTQTDSNNATFFCPASQH